MRKIIFIVPYPFIPPKNGGHWAAYGFAEFLAKERALEVYSTFEDEKNEAPFKVRGLFPNRFFKYFSPLIQFRIWRRLRQDKPKLIILHQHFMGFLVAPIAFLLRTPLAVYIQNLEYRRFRSMGKKWWPLMFLSEWLIYRCCRHLFFISPDEVEPAKKVFGIPARKCKVVPFGTFHSSAPLPHPVHREKVIQKHNFSRQDRLILFFGPQSYLPNLEAVERIVRNIAPSLAEKADFSFRFLICGGGLPSSYEWIKQAANIEYLGYVPDIEEYVLAADLVINPINSGGGVKTKLIEAIALGKTVVSSFTGALGVNPEKCGNKLVRVEDEDYSAFAQAIVDELPQANDPTPASFYEDHFWGNAIKPVLALTKQG